MKEKTILQWFEQAKAEGLEWADAAIKNTKKHRREKLCESMNEAVWCAFGWNQSPQGHDYWKKIADSVAQ